MTRVRLHDKVALGHTVTDARGFLRCDQAPMAQAGTCQVYTRAELGVAGPGPALKIWRDAGDVFDKASLASWRNCTIVEGHDTMAITADNWKAASVGMVLGDVRQSNNHVVGAIEIRDAAAIASVRAGTVGLSAAYSADIVLGAGVADTGERFDGRQTNIVIESLALVPSPRCQTCTLTMGDAAISARKLGDKAVFKLADCTCANCQQTNARLHADAAASVPEDAPDPATARAAGMRAALKAEADTKNRYGEYVTGLGGTVTGPDQVGTEGPST